MDEALRVIDGGAVTDRTASGGTLDLGATTAGGAHASTHLDVVDATSFSMTASALDFQVVNRLQAGVLMLCDAATTPGSSPARYVAVALQADSGGAVATTITDVGALAGKTFYELRDCVYADIAGNSQGQSVAHDAQTNSLSVAAGGDVNIASIGSAYSAAHMELMLGGTVYNGHRFSAFRFTFGGAERIVLVEQIWFDEMSPVVGAVKLWLQD